MKRIENSQAIGTMVAMAMSIIAAVFTIHWLIDTEFKPIDFEINVGSIISIAILYFLCVLFSVSFIYPVVYFASYIIILIIERCHYLLLPKDMKQKIRERRYSDDFFDKACDRIHSIVFITTVILSPILGVCFVADLEGERYI